jgi:pyruvate/2-oxoglutarate/acetoin dehydrogenase E1 component
MINTVPFRKAAIQRGGNDVIFVANLPVRFRTQKAAYNKG